MTTYVCPLHPDHPRSEPGTCAQCGRQLEPREEERASRPRAPKAKPIRDK